MAESMSATLWLGEIEPHMDEAFVTDAFANMGYAVITVKEMYSKVTGERANYCFVDFGDVNVAREVLIKLNNEPIPGTKNKKFKLNRSEYGRSNPTRATEFSMFVGDLSPEVDDNQLLDFFRKKYSSARAANVVRDELGNPKGFGFVRFFEEEEHGRALREMNGAKGLGQRQIRVNRASKSKGQGSGASFPQPGGGDSMDASQMPPPQWMQMQMQYIQQMHEYVQQCHQFAQQAAQYATSNQSENQTSSTTENSGKQQENESADNISDESAFMNHVQQEHQQMLSRTAEVDEDQELVDPDADTADVTALNREIIERSDRLFFELEASRWDFESSYLKAHEQRLVKIR